MPKSRHNIALTINGKGYEREVSARLTMADFLRNELGLTGTHVGCEHGVCGACTILMDGCAIRSCILYAVQSDGHEIRTVEGLASGSQLHPLQRAFIEHNALQCGFCTPGFLMTAVDLIARVPDPSAQEIREALSGSICRCTGYQPIIEAVLSALPKLRAGRT